MMLRKALLLVALLSFSWYKAQLNVTAAIDHLIPWSSDTQGNIVLTPSGGTTPYSYTWTPGAIYTKDLSNAAVGSYTVKVRESSATNIFRYYSLGYKTRWIEHYGTNFRNDSLMSNGASGFSNRSSITKNTLPASTDGWVEYVVGTYSSPYVLGFLDSVSTANYGAHQDIDFALHVTTGYAFYSFSGGSFTYHGTVNPGDVLRVERIGTTYYLKKNTVTVTTATANTKKLKVKGLIATAPLTNIGVSFTDTSAIQKPQLNDLVIDHVKRDGVDSIGSVYLNHKWGQAPFLYRYNSSPTTNNPKDLSRTSYTVTLKDANNDSTVKKFDLGYKVGYKTFWGTTFRNDTLISNSANTPTGNPSAASINELRPNTNGWIQLVLKNYDYPYVIGFCDTILPAYYGGINDMNFGFHITTSGALYAWSAGSFYYLGTSKAGDVMKVVRTGSTYSLTMNSSSIFTSAANAVKNLRIKVSHNNTGTIANLGASFADSTTGNPLKVFATVDHVNTDGIDQGGNVTIKVSGGRSPYNFKWTPGPIVSQNLSNSSRNFYTLRVKDNKGDSTFRYYNIGYKTGWKDFYGVQFRNDTLLSDGSFSGNKTAISTNILHANTNGWVEYVIGTFTYPYLIGLLDTAYTANQGAPNDVDFGFHETTGNYAYCFVGGNFTFLGTVTKGDVIRLERSGSTFLLKKNNVTIYSSSADASKRLRVKALLDSQPLANIGTSFSNTFAAATSQLDANCGSVSTGSIGITASGGIEPYTFLWNNATTASSITNIGSGVYSATITDSHFDRIFKTFTVTNCPSWKTNSVTTVQKISNGELRKTSSATWEDSFLEGQHQFNFSDTAKWVSFMVNDTISNLLFGFGNSLNDTLEILNPVNYKVQLLNSALIVSETDNDGFYNRLNIGNVTTNDKIKIQFTKKGIEYYINDAIVYTSKLFSDALLRLEAQIYSSSTSIKTIRVSHN